MYRGRICLPVRHRVSCLGYVWLLDDDPGPRAAVGGRHGGGGPHRRAARRRGTGGRRPDPGVPGGADRRTRLASGTWRWPRCIRPLARRGWAAYAWCAWRPGRTTTRLRPVRAGDRGPVHGADQHLTGARGRGWPRSRCGSVPGTRTRRRAVRLRSPGCWPQRDRRHQAPGLGGRRSRRGIATRRAAWPSCPAPGGRPRRPLARRQPSTARPGRRMGVHRPVPAADRAPPGHGARPRRTHPAHRPPTGTGPHRRGLPRLRGPGGPHGGGPGHPPADAVLPPVPHRAADRPGPGRRARTGCCCTWR